MGKRPSFIEVWMKFQCTRAFSLHFRVFFRIFWNKANFREFFLKLNLKVNFGLTRKNPIFHLFKKNCLKKNFSFLLKKKAI